MKFMIPGVDPAKLPARLRWTWIWLAACLAVVLAGNLAGAFVIAASREEALATALLQVRIDLAERARALEATLRAGAAELDFLAASGPLSGLPEALAGGDPVLARFRRLDAEGSFLRYLTAHPEIERLFVRDSQGAPVLAVGRRASFPVPIPLQAASGAATAGRLRQEVPLPAGDGALVADIHPASLLSSLATGTGRAVLLGSAGTPLAGTPEAFRRLKDSGSLGEEGAAGPRDGWAAVTLDLHPVGLGPDESWVLARAEREDDLLAGLGSVSARYRALLALNGLAVAATLLLGFAAVRTARRRARLEEVAAQRDRLREMESRLQEADRLAAVGRMAATLAHEVRNPLEGMRNWLSLVESEARAFDSEKLLGYAGRVGDGIDHLAEVVRRVLNLAKPSEGTMEALDLDAVVGDALDSIEGSRPFRTHRIVRELAGGLPRVRGDRVLLGQLLLNLLLNARDATPAGGRILIATSGAASHVSLVVQDEGPGIAEAVRPQLFEAFASGKGSTGLGLALCARVARVHAGSIEAENPAEGGARFTLTLPAEGAEAPAVEEVPR